MTDFRIVKGFEDVWRPPVRLAIKRPEGRSVGSPEPRARLARLAARVPEVMVKVTGRTRDPAHLKAHLTYITRNGELPAEDRDGLLIVGRREVVELARDWAAVQLNDSRRRERSPFSVGIILSMPQGTDAFRLRDAAREFARSAFGERFDYVFALHTDASHPHVHLTVRALGDHGERLNPKKADLEAWRQSFAQALRDRGIAAEATPRRARGVTRKAERTPIRKIRERAEAGRGLAGWVRRAAYHEAAGLAFGGAARASPWDDRIVQRQRRVRALYLGQARLLQASDNPSDRALGRAVEDFVKGMPAPDTQRLALARELRAANAKLRDRPADQDRSERRGRTR
jgi:hypothetical protein